MCQAGTRKTGWLWKATSTCQLPSHWPHWTTAIFIAKSPDTLREQATSLCLLLSWIFGHLTLPALPSHCSILELYCGHSLPSSMRTVKNPIWAFRPFSKERHEQIWDRAGDPGRPSQWTGYATDLEKLPININPKGPTADCYRFLTLHAKNVMTQIYIPSWCKPWGWSSCNPWVLVSW